MNGRTPPPRFTAAPYLASQSPPAGVLRLDTNEGSSPEPALLRRLAEADVQVIRAYPSTLRLERLLADRLGVAADRVVVTNGADVALDRVCRAWLAPGSELLVAEPTFEMFYRFAEMTGATLVGVPWVDRFPLEALLDRVTPSTGIIAVVSPNNPTGLVCSASELRRIADAAPQSIVLLDHVYVEYADEDLTGLALTLPNVIVVRTLSKAWGLAGCRVGYAVADPAAAAVIRSAGDPFPVAGPSLFLAEARVSSGAGSLALHVGQVRRERDDLLRRFGEWGCPCPSSRGNFVFPLVGPEAAAIRSALAAEGLLVRHFADRPALAEHLRITLPGHEATYERLAAALGRLLGRIGGTP
jgi:histidinol-phosphate aminotransferase